MIKSATILTAQALDSLAIDHITQIANTMINNGVIAEVTIDGDIIVLTGIFQRGINQAMLAIGSYIKHNLSIEWICE